MIRTNLSTRPFYNERAVHALAARRSPLAVVAATAFNVARVVRYSRSDTQLATQASRDEARAADLRTPGGAAAGERRPASRSRSRRPTRGRPTT